MVRGVIQDVPCSAGYFLSLCNSAERANWDTMCAKGYLVEVIDDFTQVTYERYHPIFPTSARDFVVLNSVSKVLLKKEFRVYFFNFFTDFASARMGRTCGLQFQWSIQIVLK